MRRRTVLTAPAATAVAGPADATERPMTPCCPVVEYRRYRCVPGRGDELMALFERELLESQEAHGAVVIGQFRDLDEPDR
ncbi:MAG TPA: hypothetical protein VEC60_04530, partial [Reyranella sp.]|nr:hypothetical protein [Reyranella sp.]